MKTVITIAAFALLTLGLFGFIQSTNFQKSHSLQTMYEEEKTMPEIKTEIQNKVDEPQLENPKKKVDEKSLVDKKQNAKTTIASKKDVEIDNKTSLVVLKPEKKDDLMEEKVVDATIMDNEKEIKQIELESAKTETQIEKPKFEDLDIELFSRAAPRKLVLKKEVKKKK